MQDTQLAVNLLLLKLSLLLTMTTNPSVVFHKNKRSVVKINMFLLNTTLMHDLSKKFLWLAFWGRLNTKANMVRKSWSVVAPNADCDICLALESIDHLVLRCRPAIALWNKLLLAPLACLSPDIMYFVEHADQQLAFKRKWNIAFAACAITLWHARNDRVFNAKCWTESYIRFYAADMILLWSNRARKQQDKDALQTWINLIDG